MKKVEIIYKKIDEITPYENNPRNNEEAVKYVAESIKQFGFKNPIIIDKDNVIIAGHTRLKAAQKLGLKEVPTIQADDLTPDQIKAFRIADNKVAEFSTWDIEKLEIELADIDLDMSSLGFEDLDLKEEKEVEEDNFDIDEYLDEEPPKTKLGEIYKLGHHYLMCGDSTKEKDVEKLMEAAGTPKEADLLFTDPPYNVNVHNSDGLTIENDNLNSDIFSEFLNNAFKCASNHLKDGGAFYIWHGDSESINFRTACANNDLLVKECLIWVKNHFNLGRQDYQWRHEPCLYGWKEGAAHYFVDNRSLDTIIEDEIDLDKMKKEDMKKLLEEIYSDKVATTIIHEDKPLKNDLHPTMKPLKMCADLIKNSSRQDEIVLDLFGGSGSTLLACEQINRNCYMMELDEKYCDVIIERWETFTGEKAVKIN